MSSLSKDKSTPVKTVSASEEPGLPEPTNASSGSTMPLNSLDEHLRLGEQELERGDYQQAKLHFEHVLQKHPDDVKAHHRLGVIADKTGQFAQAEQHYLTALSSEPQNAALLSDLGYSYFLQGRLAESERYLLQARRVDPDYSTSIANLGLLYASTGRQQEALAMFRQIGDEAQIQSIMQQIAAGQFSSAPRGTAGPYATQQASIVTMQTSVQSAAPIPPQEMNEATRQFVEQLRSGYDEQGRTDPQYTQRQATAQSTMPPYQGSSAATNWPQPSNWQQDPSRWANPQQTGAPLAIQHPQPQGGYVPNDALAGMIAAIDRPAQPNSSSTPIVISPPDTGAPQPQQAAEPYYVRPGTSAPTGSAQSVPVYGGPTPQQFAPQQALPPQMTQAGVPQQNGSPQTPYGMSTIPQSDGTAQPQEFLQAGNDRRSESAVSAWAQQYATLVNQQQPQSGVTPNDAIQPASAYADPYGQGPVAYAHHTEQAGQRPDVMLAGQSGAAGSSLVPPSLNGNWSSPPQPANGPPMPTASRSAEGISNYEQSRREAALLGLGAGPGQLFPYVQQTQRMMPGTDSRLNGGQYPAPVRQMSTGLTPPDLNPVPAAPQTTNLAPPASYQGQAMPSAPVPANAPPNNAAAPGGNFDQHQQMSYQPPPSQPRSDPYQDARRQQSGELNGLINQTWGQSPQSPPYGVTPPSAIQQYGSAAGNPLPTGNMATAPQYQRGNEPSVQRTTSGDDPKIRGNQWPAPPSNPGGVVIPEPYYYAEPAASGSGQLPSSQSQQYGQRPADPQRYAAPMIVPGQR